MLGLVSIIYGLIRSNLLDIALGVAVVGGGSPGYLAIGRRRQQRETSLPVTEQVPEGLPGFVL